MSQSNTGTQIVHTMQNLLGMFADCFQGLDMFQHEQYTILK